MQDTSKILHSHKVDRPGIDGGIPFAIAALSRPVDTVANIILVARRCGKGRYMSDGAPGRSRDFSVDILVYHAPFPFVDVVSGLLPNDVGLIVYWR